MTIGTYSARPFSSPSVFAAALSERSGWRRRWLLSVCDLSKGLSPGGFKRGLVSFPGVGPWSSCRFYFLQDASILAMDRLG